MMELTEMFPDEASARRWFEGQVWPDGEPVCPKCGSPDRVKETPNAKPCPYWCGECRAYFSAKTGTAIERSKVSYRKWVFAIYLETTSLKSVSSMKLHRDLGVTQTTAWFMAHRLREAWVREVTEFSGPVEVDETYFGGRERNRHAKDRKGLGRGSVGKTAVVGAKDRGTNRVSATVVARTDGATLQGFVRERVKEGATVFTDDAKAYAGLVDFEHETVRHSVAEYVRGQAHTNGIESFWSMLKRAHKGTFHKLSAKHLHRYVREFAGSHNMRDLNTITQMGIIARGLVGRRLTYSNLTA